MLKITKTLLYFVFFITTNYLSANNVVDNITVNKQPPGKTIIDFSVSPNPVTNNRVEVTFTRPVSTYIYIHDNLGDIVFKVPIENKQTINLALNDLNAGIFFISVKTKEKTIIKRLIKY